MIPGAFRVSAGVPLDRVTGQSGKGANWSRAPAISGIDRAEYELEGGGALSERQRPAEREEPSGSYSTGDRMKAWGRIGVVWGALWGALFPEFFRVHGLRTVFGVPVTSWIIGALEGALVLGICTALVAGLLSLGVFNRSARATSTHGSNNEGEA